MRHNPARLALHLRLSGASRRTRLALPRVARFPDVYGRLGRSRSFYRRAPRGGFFKDLVKGVGRVVSVAAKIPIVGAVAKTVISATPVLGGVVTAIGAFKSTVKPPTIANTANTTATTGAPPIGEPQPQQSNRRSRAKGARRKAQRVRRRSTKRAPARARKARRTKARGGVSAKQRAARARFARAAKKGKIRRGSKL